MPYKEDCPNCVGDGYYDTHCQYCDDGIPLRECDFYKRNPRHVLELEFESMDFNKPITIREYLEELLKTLWREGEGFSGKRPFGNSGWQYDMYSVLKKKGLIREKLDEKEADKFIMGLIDYMCKEL